jgi:hypothetical protein
MDIVIGRDEGTVTVTCRGEGGSRSVRQLRHVLGDLVDGQGNLNTHVEFPGTAGVDAAIVHLLVDVAGRLSSRGGRLSVVTATGRWTSAQPEVAGAR